MLNIDERDQCEWCHGVGYFLEDRDAYFYYSAEQIRNANREKNKERQREIIEEVKNLKGIPMQPYAVECPKCHGTGLRI